MKVTLFPGPAKGCVAAIPSKSHLHRLLIFASFADKPTRILCEHSHAEDIQATVNCLTALGAKIETQAGGFLVTPKGACAPNRGGHLFPCGESGSTLRFMLPIVCAMGISGEFSMSGRLPERPLAPLDTELTRHGISLQRPGPNTLRCKGKLAAGEYILPGNVSSQFISGLLMALPLLEGDSSITVEGPLESADYIAMTLAAGKVFGGAVMAQVYAQKKTGTVYTIKGGGMYSSPGEIVAEGDWSNAAFWLCADAMPGSAIEVSGLNSQSLQGDRAITAILEQISQKGASNGGARHFDARAIPDLVPVLCAVAAVGAGETAIKNAGRLRLKESDRLTATARTLNTLGAKVIEEPEGLRIQGVERLRGGEVDAWGDHRIAMTAAVASLACDGPVIINGAQAVRKSYPAFWETLGSLGKKITIEE